MNCKEMWMGFGISLLSFIVLLHYRLIFDYEFLNLWGFLISVFWDVFCPEIICFIFIHMHILFSLLITLVTFLLCCAFLVYLVTSGNSELQP